MKNMVGYKLMIKYGNLRVINIMVQKYINLKNIH